jgi:hypothetical protein
MVSIVQIAWHQIIACLVNTELERMWKEIVTARFKVLFQHVPGEIEEHHEAIIARHV